MTPEPELGEDEAGALKRSRKVVDEGHEAANEAMHGDPLSGDLEVPGIGTDAEGDDSEEVTPRPI